VAARIALGAHQLGDMYPLRPLDDEQDLSVFQSVNHGVRPTDMGDDRQSLGLVIEQDRIVRGDQLAVVVADQNSPRVLADQPSDDVGTLRGGGGFGRTSRPDSAQRRAVEMRVVLCEQCLHRVGTT
jgi:hypothetical protein